MANIGALPQHDARILAQLPGNLTVADIDAVNAPRSCLQQAIRKATCRNTTVEAIAIADVNCKGFQGLQQLFATPGYEAIGLACVQACLALDFRAGFVNAIAIDKHQARSDGALRLLARRVKFSFDQEQVETLFAQNSETKKPAAYPYKV